MPNPHNKKKKRKTKPSPPAQIPTNTAIQVLQPTHLLRRARRDLAPDRQPDRLLAHEHHDVVRHGGEPVQQRRVGRVHGQQEPHAQNAGRQQHRQQHHDGRRFAPQVRIFPSLSLHLLPSHHHHHHLPPSKAKDKDKDKANPSQSWVSDLVWLDTENYNSTTGSGSLGAEFAGTAVSSNSPFGANSTISDANNQSSLLVRDNAELQWQEGYYRGYYELRLSGDEVNASYFGLPDLRSRNGLEISLANFTVKDGEGRLQRPVGGGRVESGALKGEGAEVVGGNLTRDTRSGEWFVGRWNFTGVTLAGSD